jgi:hypothetical protein
MSLSKGSRDLFEAAKEGGAPSRADRERVRNKVDRRLAAAGAAAAVGALATKTAAGTTGLGATGAGLAAATVAKIVMPVVVLGVAVTAATVHVARQARPAAAVVSTTAPAATDAPRPETGEHPPAVPPVVAPVSPAPPTVAPEPAPSPPPSAWRTIDRTCSRATSTGASPVPAPVRPPGVISTSPSAAAPPATLASSKSPPPQVPSEIALVEAMNAALARGDAATTLGLASEHARLYPVGTLAQERDGARALALCMVGTTTAAREFLDAHRSSPLVGRLHAVCDPHGDSIQGRAPSGQ